MTTIHAIVIANERRLAASGVHRLTPWWFEQLARFFAGAYRVFVGRVGRGGTKSHVAVKVAIASVLGRDWRVPTGERHFFAFVSQNKSEASQRLVQIETWLRILGVRCTRRGDAVDLDDLPLGFRVFACQIGAVSGFRCIGFVCDELAKWRNAMGANPAREVVASLRAMCVTHPDHLEWYISSPVSHLDLHFEMFEAGESDRQMVASAPSWVANPSVTKEQTRELESDDRIWLREYAAEPQAAELALLRPEWVDRATEPRPEMTKARRALFIDPSAGKRDTFAWVVAGWNVPDESNRWKRDQYGDIARSHITGKRIQRTAWKPQGAPYFCVDAVGGFEGAFYSAHAGDAIVDRLADIARQHKVTAVFGDSFEQLMLSSAFSRHGLRYTPVAITGQNKPKAVTMLRRWFSEGLIKVPAHEKLLRELRAFEERISASGHFTYDSRGVHADYLACIITAAVAELERELSRSPMHPTSQVTVGRSPIGPYGGGGFLQLGPSTDLPSADEIRHLARTGQLPKL